jgi:hypothetical protein
MKRLSLLSRRKWDVNAGKCTTLVFLYIYQTLANVFLISFLQETWNHTLIVHYSALVQLEGSDCATAMKLAQDPVAALQVPHFNKWVINFFHNTITTNQKYVQVEWWSNEIQLFFLLSLHHALIKYLLVDN